MPKRKDPPLDPKEQFKRFQETAKEHGVEEASEKIDASFNKLSAETAKKAIKRSR